MKPRLLDLFCGGGGATRGYQQAGFTVWGVDINWQPNYIGDAFHHGDALEFLADFGDQFDVIHASPPCQDYSNLTAVNRKLGRTNKHQRLIAETRELLQATGKPYVIENIADAGRELIDPVRICGTAFGLPIRRHRLFESNVPIVGTGCEHSRFTEPKYWTGWRPNGEHRLSTVVQVYGNAGGTEHWPAAMGIDWMTNREMAEAIPPAYARHVGEQLMAALEGQAAA